MKWTVRAVLLGGLLALAPVVPAQAQYPIQPVNQCVSSPSPIDLGVMNVGDFRGVEVCGPWVSPQNATVSINGVTFLKPVNANGAVAITVQITSPTTAQVNPAVPIACGQNVINISAVGAGGVNIVKQVVFTVNCNQFGQPFAPNFGNFFNPFGTPFNQGAFAIPGSPGLVVAPSQSTHQQQQEQQQQIALPAGSSGGSAAPAPSGAAPAQAAQGRVAFTGANVIRWSIAALTLMAIGALLLLHSRRRRPSLSA